MALSGILARIVERTLAEARARDGRAHRAELRRLAADRGGTRRPLVAALRRDGPAVPAQFLCEIKKGSPSRGVLAPDLQPEALAAVYRAEGAAAVSVVTEPHFFFGSPRFLDEARRGAGDLPLLRKDFHVHEIQILETAAGEADALLFLGSVLDPVQLRDFLEMAREYHLSHLVEVDDTRQAEAALKAGAEVIGVNNRDLATFRVDVTRTESVLPALRGTGAVSVAESGIHDRETVLRLERAGVDAVLIGEALVTAADPAAKLRELRGLDAPGDS